jgi:D-alanyl-lipoteichoic acid acyltransferase DltB (MBOAT superfamily)
MVFSSALFLSFFLPLLLGVYFVVSPKLRNYILLVSSLLFYAWGEPKTVFIMIGLIVVSWKIGILLDQVSKTKRKYLLILGVTLNLSALFFYKYWMFFL